MADQKFNETVAALFEGMDKIISTKTVVGDAVTLPDGTIILPLVDVSFGMGAGAYAGGASQKAGGGMGGKITPNAVLVLKDGRTKLVPVTNDTMSKMLDMIPEVVDRIKKKPEDKAAEAAMTEAGKQAVEGSSESTF